MDIKKKYLLSAALCGLLIFVFLGIGYQVFALNETGNFFISPLQLAIFAIIFFYNILFLIYCVAKKIKGYIIYIIQSIIILLSIVSFIGTISNNTTAWVSLIIFLISLFFFWKEE